MDTTHTKLNCVLIKTALKPEAKVAVDESLSRTSLFWNFMIHHTTKIVEAYLLEPTSTTSDLKLDQAFQAVFNCLVKQKMNSECQAIIDPDWEKFLPTINVMKPSVLKNRLNDLIVSYHRCKGAICEGKPELSNVPRRKTTSSSQSIRFDSEDFMIIGSSIHVDTWFAPFILEVPNLEVSPRKAYTLSITKKAKHKEPEVFGPTGVNDQLYTITLREVLS